MGLRNKNTSIHHITHRVQCICVCVFFSMLFPFNALTLWLYSLGIWWVLALETELFVKKSEQPRNSFIVNRKIYCWKQKFNGLHIYFVKCTVRVVDFRFFFFSLFFLPLHLAGLACFCCGCWFLASFISNTLTADQIKLKLFNSQKFVVREIGTGFDQSSKDTNSIVNSSAEKISRFQKKNENQLHITCYFKRENENELTNAEKHSILMIF